MGKGERRAGGGGQTVYLQKGSHTGGEWRCYNKEMAVLRRRLEDGRLKKNKKHITV